MWWILSSKRQEMPSPVIPGEGVNLVNDDYLSSLRRRRTGPCARDMSNASRLSGVVNRMSGGRPEYRLDRLGHIPVPNGRSAGRQVRHSRRAASSRLLSSARIGHTYNTVRPRQSSESIRERMGSIAASVFPPAVGARRSSFAHQDRLGSSVPGAGGATRPIAKEFTYMVLASRGVTGLKALNRFSSTHRPDCGFTFRPRSSPRRKGSFV